MREREIEKKERRGREEGKEREGGGRGGGGGMEVTYDCQAPPLNMHEFEARAKFLVDQHPCSIRLGL